MKTAEEILDRFESDQGQSDNMPQYLYTRYDALSAMEEYANQSKWVSVDKGLPDIGNAVLVFTSEGAILKGKLLNDGIWTAYFSDGEQTISGEVQAITHWQPLPQNP